MISSFETLAVDLNHRAINRLYSYRKKKGGTKYSFVSNARNHYMNFHASSHGPRLLVFILKKWTAAVIERLPCGNIFTAFLAIRKKISTKKAAAKFDLQCYNTCRNTFSLTNVVTYEKCPRVDFSMNNTLA